MRGDEVISNSRSNRYPCLNNAPDLKSASFEGLNNEQTARERPGRFNDLDDQCRRAFGIDLEYCKDLSHGVSRQLFVGNYTFVPYSRNAFACTVARNHRRHLRV